MYEQLSALFRGGIAVVCRPHLLAQRKSLPLFAVEGRNGKEPHAVAHLENNVLSTRKRGAVLHGTVLRMQRLVVLGTPVTWFSRQVLVLFSVLRSRQNISRRSRGLDSFKSRVREALEQSF